MRDGDGGVFIEQKLHQGATDQIGAADHHGVHTLERSMHALGQDDAAQRRTRRQRRKAAGQPPGIVRMQTVDVLGRIDRIDDGFGMQRFGQRQLHQDPVHGGIAIELSDQGQQVALWHICRQHMLE